LLKAALAGTLPVMRPRLRDVAVHTGVSEATVSRVLNNRPGVAAGTRTRVLDALAALGHPGQGEVVPTRARTVGIVVPELDNPVFPLFVQAIERRLHAQGLSAIIASATMEGAPEPSVVAMLRERDVEGFVFVSGLHADRDADHSTYRRLAEEGVPVVLINGAVDGLECPAVSADDQEAGHLAVRHLWVLGHRRIGFAGGLDSLQPTRRKLAGVRAALRAAGGPPPIAVEAPFTVEGGQLSASSLLRDGCTGIVAASDLIALGAIRAARSTGLDVPGDVSVIGFDDTMMVAHTDPPLTTIRQPIQAMAAAAADTLAASLAGTGTVTGEYLFQPDLIARASTGPAPAVARTAIA
jgi:LacI family transcriptional regulator, repressor for deo operon, udp, cdd, tsx, nupC, and nupG